MQTHYTPYHELDKVLSTSYVFAHLLWNDSPYANTWVYLVLWNNTERHSNSGRGREGIYCGEGNLVLSSTHLDVLPQISRSLFWVKCHHWPRRKIAFGKLAVLDVWRRWPGEVGIWVELISHGLPHFLLPSLLLLFKNRNQICIQVFKKEGICSLIYLFLVWNGSRKSLKCIIQSGLQKPFRSGKINSIHLNFPKVQLH